MRCLAVREVVTARVEISALSRVGRTSEISLGGRLGAASRSRPAVPKALSQLDVRGLGSLVAGFGVVGDLCALGERAVALADDCTVMDEQVLGLVIGRDEPKSLVVAEPLDGSGSHRVSSYVDSAANAEIAEQKLRPLALRCRAHRP